jgi:hypothetical protein
MTNRFPRLSIPVVTVTVALLLGSCSSDGDDAATTTTEPVETETETTIAAADDPRLDLRGPTEITGPIEGGQYGVPYAGMPEGWEEEYGYTEEEWFFSGDAVAYPTAEPLTSDGRWTVEPVSATEAYATRMIVRRPADPADFNGTLVIEWLNVTAGRDSDPDFGYLAEELLTQGYAYAAVSAQKIGVEPGGLGLDIPNVPPEALYPLKEWDPERYGELSHPGDAWSYDIFTQAARALLDVDEEAPMRGLDAEHVIAAGESQSAFRLATYVNAVQPVTEMFDGFLIHARGDGAADLGDDPSQKPPAVVTIRDDIEVPVLQVESETDLELLGFVAARQDDTDLLRTWEIAGAAHADQSTLDYAIQAGARWTDADVDLSSSCGTINDGPQEPVMQAALAALRSWIADGTLPPSSPRLETDEAGAIVRDADGNALGGIRTPAVDVPVATLSGTNTTPSVICSLFGSTTPFSAAELAERYGSSADYVEAVRASAEEAVAEGFLLERHVDEFVEAAEQVEIG